MRSATDASWVRNSDVKPSGLSISPQQRQVKLLSKSQSVVLVEVGGRELLEAGHASGQEADLSRLPVGSK